MKQNLYFILHWTKRRSGLACHFRGEITGPLSGDVVWRLIVSTTSNMNHSIGADNVWFGIRALSLSDLNIEGMKDVPSIDSRT